MIVVSMLAKEGRKKKMIMESLLSLLRPQSIRIKKQSKLVQDYMNIVTTFIHYVLIYIRHKLLHSYSGSCKEGVRTGN